MLRALPRPAPAAPAHDPLPPQGLSFSSPAWSNLPSASTRTTAGTFRPLYATLFPGDNGLNTSSTPWLDNTAYTFYVQSIDGYVGFAGGASALRLVSLHP